MGTKPGVASGILSMSRMVGGTFGVAALGALVSAVGRHDIDSSLPKASAGLRDRLAENLGSVPAKGLAPDVASAATNAFILALHVGLKVGGGVAFLGAVVAVTFVSNREEHNAGAEILQHDVPLEIGIGNQADDQPQRQKHHDGAGHPPAPFAHRDHRQVVVRYPARRERR